VIEESPETAWRPRERPPRRRRRNRRTILLLALGGLLLFLFGLSFGLAMRSNPRPGGTQTTERPLTVKVSPLHP
jgi:hypothetical protein